MTTAYIIIAIGVVGVLAIVVSVYLHKKHIHYHEDDLKQAINEYFDKLGEDTELLPQRHALPGGACPQTRLYHASGRESEARLRSSRHWGHISDKGFITKSRSAMSGWGMTSWGVSRRNWS